MASDEAARRILTAALERVIPDVDSPCDICVQMIDVMVDALPLMPPDVVAAALGWERVARSDCGDIDCASFATRGPCEHVGYDYRPPADNEGDA